MNAIRKILAALSAIVSILFIFLALGLIGQTLSKYAPTTLTDRIVPWVVVALFFCLAYVLMRFASKTLR
jgi:hypothetical protein